MNEGFLTPVKREKGESITMDFPNAMREVLNKKSVTRISWANNDYCLLKDDWLTIFTKGEFHTWLINNGDMEGNDWIVIKETN